MHRPSLALLSLLLAGSCVACANGGGDGGSSDASLKADGAANDGNPDTASDAGSDAPIVGCGAPGAACCIGGACLDGLSCLADRCVPTCGVVGQTCCAGNKCDAATVCLGGTCKAPTDCGDEGKACCASGVCVGALVCSAGTCSKATSCGTAGAACCAGGACSAGSQCTGGICVVCGGAGQACCAGSSCSAGATCDASSSKCLACGAPSQPCCAGSSCAGGGYCFSGGCLQNPTLTATFPEGPECADLGTAHATGLARHVVKGRPSAPVTQFYRHVSCGDAFSSRPFGATDATGTFVDDVGNVVITDCKHTSGGRWEVYFTIDGAATPHSFSTFYNSTCPAPLSTCAGATTFCPVP